MAKILWSLLGHIIHCVTKFGENRHSSFYIIMNLPFELVAVAPPMGSVAGVEIKNGNRYFCDLLDLEK